MRGGAGPSKAIKDDLYRLTSATNTTTPAESQTWIYDAIGRIEYNSRVGSYTYPGVGLPRPHAPTQCGTNAYGYDPNGNMLAGAGRTLAWDANNRLSQAILASGTTNFAYDADGDRLKKATPSSTISLYPLGDDDYEITGGVVTKYFSMQGVSIAKKVGSGGGAQTFWLHGDRLGSVQAITDGTGAVVQRRTYRPYGEKIADSTGHLESKGWINERNDTETGLTYLHARYYDPAIGAFISPDPMHPDSPGVGLHRYGYAGADPINLKDPRGLSYTCTEYTQSTCGNAGCTVENWWECEEDPLIDDGPGSPSRPIPPRRRQPPPPPPPPPVDCATNPTDPSCTQPPVDCSTNPTDPSCQQPPVDCTSNPSDPSCKQTPNEKETKKHACPVGELDCTGIDARFDEKGNCLQSGPQCYSNCMNAVLLGPIGDLFVAAGAGVAAFDAWANSPAGFRTTAVTRLANLLGTRAGWSAVNAGADINTARSAYIAGRALGTQIGGAARAGATAFAVVAGGSVLGCATTCGINGCTY